jgi:hypothetical protein
MVSRGSGAGSILVDFSRSTLILWAGNRRSRPFLEFAAMPSLIRLLMVLGLLGGFAYGAMFALANFVQPKQREMSITIPAQKLAKPN